MTSRERVIAAIRHIQPDKVPVDLGSNEVTGICALAHSNLKKAIGLNESPKIMNPQFMLAEVEEEERRLLGVDLVRLAGDINKMGFKNENYKPWELFDGTEVLIGEGFSYTQDDDGNLYYHPMGDPGTPPSAKMPRGGYYFDALPRQQAVDETNMDAREDYKEDFVLFDEGTLRTLERKADYFYSETEYATCGAFYQGGLADFGKLPGITLKNPQGIRNPEDWMMAYYLYPEYVKEAFEFQTEMAIENLKLYHQAVGEKIQVICISATDFGTQRGELIAPDTYREFFKPYHKRMNDWVHQNTGWKVFYHTCGSVVKLLSDFADCGIDILNPVQCSAAGMEPKFLKEKYGDKFVFWGGAIDTQNTLQFGSPEDVRKEALERLAVFSKGGGYVFNAIHNIQPCTPPENIIALYDAVKEFNAKH